jgi:hypothetical protein
MSELKFSQMYEDSDYLTAFDLINQGAVELTVERIEKPKGLEIQGRKVDKPVIYFVGAKKGWVCSKTKMMELVLRFAPEAKSPAGLVGKKIRIMCDLNAKNPAYPGGRGPAIVVAK